MRNRANITRVIIWKATGFTYLRVNCLDVKQVTPKWQMNFFDKTCKKGLKQNKWTLPWIFQIRNSLGIKFQLKLTNLNFWTKLTQKRYFWSKKEKKQNHLWILDIPISLGSRIQLQQTILTFYNNFPKQGYFQRKTEKMNITTKFFIFNLV